MFSSIGIVLLRALTGPVKYSRTVVSEKDSALLTITNSVFRFVDLYREDVSVVCDSEC